MSKSGDEFNYESLQDCDSIVKYLTALLDGFKTGRIIVGVKDKQIILEPQGLVKLEVEGERKDDKTKLRLKFQWREERKMRARLTGDEFVIFSDKAEGK